MNLPSGCVVVDYVISSLQNLVGSHLGGQSGVVDYLVFGSDHIDSLPHIGEVEDEVKISICGLPYWGDVKVGSHEVEAELEVNLVLVISNKGNSPS